MAARLILFLVAMVLSACSSSQKQKDDLLKDLNRENPMFERGLKYLEKEKYAEAAHEFDTLLLQKPGTELDLVTLYNSGAAHEGLGNCTKAAERYREVIRSSAGGFKLLEAQTLLRLSMAYECLGQDAKVIAALLDARKRGKELPYETRQAEIPARLAAAYARLGNRKKALEYFNQASESLKKLVTANKGKAQKELLGRTLFLMGQLNPGQRRAEVAADSYMLGLSMQQAYLLQAAELNHPNWSTKAIADLRLGYANIWKLTTQSEKEERNLYVRGLQAINELRRIKLPNEPSAVQAIFAELDEHENRIQQALAKIATVTPLTPDAAKREGLKREGRVVDPPKAKQ
ncbi:MAG: hypothetical protein AB7F86_00625 [Bdellovibrionales bacterium]